VSGPRGEDPLATIERLRGAINAHDVDAVVDCFRLAYRSEQPVHPGRAFTGREQVRSNWTQILREVPDLEATLVNHVVEGETVWAEWAWQGTAARGAPFGMAGVTVQGVVDGRIAWARLYMEPVAPEEGTP